MTGTSDLHQLGENQTGGASTDEENLGAKRHLELVHAVNGARGGLEQSRLFVRQVLDLVALGKVARVEAQRYCLKHSDERVGPTT